ncbi:HAD-IIIA family hydrolase [Burkholderiaceae bacterium]|nr:HAD-IIIA family hydrolase [Burkholderiaceae bacterium]
MDRDGVINRSLVRGGRPFAPTSEDEFSVLPGVHLALRKLRAAGYLNIVVTNQPDITTGLQTYEFLLSVHSSIRRDLAVDAIKVCIHVDADNCTCRKPLPGLLLDAAQEFDIDLASSFMVGDRWRDVAAGQLAGCKEIFFVDYGYSERQPTPPFRVIDSLASAVRYILAGQ